MATFRKSDVITISNTPWKILGVYEHDGRGVYEAVRLDRKGRELRTVKNLNIRDTDSIALRQIEVSTELEFQVEEPKEPFMTAGQMRVLFMVFVSFGMALMKVTGFTDIPWWIVTSPLWAPAIILTLS